ncbi:MAG: hypothetical protein ACRCZI_03175 [Cetobacterium sp.]
MYGFQNSAIIAFRGTHASKDLYDDLEISNGRIFPRVQEALPWVADFIKLNPSVRLHVTGHSLGGGIAREVGRSLRLEIVTFNAASPPSAPVVNPEHSTNYHIVFDLISAWQSKNVVRIDKGYRPLKQNWALVLNHTLGFMVGIFNGIKPSHSLSNFSGVLPGSLMIASHEDAFFQEWYRHLAVKQMAYVNMIFGFPFGVGGGLPKLS